MVRPATGEPTASPVSSGGAFEVGVLAHQLALGHPWPRPWSSPRSRSRRSLRLVPVDHVEGGEGQPVLGRGDDAGLVVRRRRGTVEVGVGGGRGRRRCRWLADGRRRPRAAGPEQPRAPSATGPRPPDRSSARPDIAGRRRCGIGSADLSRRSWRALRRRPARRRRAGGAGGRARWSTRRSRCRRSRGGLVLGDGRLHGLVRAARSCRAAPGSASAGTASGGRRPPWRRPTLAWNTMKSVLE